MGNTVGSPTQLTAGEQSTMIGTVLGDGYLEVLTSGSVRLSVAHGAAQRAYVEFLYRKLQRHVRTPPSCVRVLDRRSGRRRSAYRFRTVALQALRPIRDAFYDSTGRKRIPTNIIDLLDPIALAVWFMDDGSFKNDSSGVILNTMAFSEADHAHLRDALDARYGIPTTLHTLRKWKRIYIPARYGGRFADVIRDHLDDSMRYKLQYVVAHDPVTTDPRAMARGEIAVSAQCAA